MNHTLLFHFDYHHVRWRGAYIFADVCLRIRPQDFTRLELAYQGLAVWQDNPPFKWPKSEKDKCGVAVLVSLLARLIAVFKNTDFVVLKFQLVLVTVRLRWILS